MTIKYRGTCGTFCQHQLSEYREERQKTLCYRRGWLQSKFVGDWQSHFFNGQWNEISSVWRVVAILMYWSPLKSWLWYAFLLEESSLLWWLSTPWTVTFMSFDIGFACFCLWDIVKALLTIKKNTSDWRKQMLLSRTASIWHHF